MILYIFILLKTGYYIINDLLTMLILNSFPTIGILLSHIFSIWKRWFIYYLIVMIYGFIILINCLWLLFTSFSTTLVIIFLNILLIINIVFEELFLYWSMKSVLMWSIIILYVRLWSYSQSQRLFLFLLLIR